jgi:hypothetical protein
MGSNRGRRVWGLLHIFVLSLFAISQPLLDLISRHAEFLVAHDFQPADVVALVFLLCVLLPLLAILPEILTSWLSPKAAPFVHLGVVALLASAGCLSILRRLGSVPGILLVGLAILLGLATAAGYSRLAAVRSFFSLLSPAILLVPLLFLFFSPVKTLLSRASPSPAAEVELESPAPVILVVFDEISLPTLLDEDHRIDALRYPGFARLARDSYWFRNATTVAASTTLAVPAILNGRYPDRQRLPTFADYPETLFTLLGRSHRMVAFESLLDLCPQELCGASQPSFEQWQRVKNFLSDLTIVYLHLLLPADLAADLSPITGNWRDFRRKSTKTQLRNYQGRFFLSFIDSIESEESASLYFIHPQLPHHPWRYLPSGKHYEIGDVASTNGFKGQGGLWGDDGWPVLQSFQRYLLQLGYADHLLERLMDRLKDVGLYEKSLIVVTADHGISFLPGQYNRRVGESTFNDLMPVPLLIKLPRQREGVLNDRNAETIDILPTIAEVEGIRELPWPVDGHSLLDPDRAEGSEKSVFSFGIRQVLRVRGPFLEASSRAADRMLSLFGSGSEPERLFAIGPYPELMGRPEAAVGPGAEVEAEVRLDWPQIYDEVGSDPDFAPVLISGRARWRQPADSPLTLLVSVNGTIRAATRTFSAQARGGWARFKAMVPESSFVPGRNRVRAWAVAPQGGWMSDGMPSDGTPRTPAAGIFADGFETGGLAPWLHPKPAPRAAVDGLRLRFEPWQTGRR